MVTVWLGGQEGRAGGQPGIIHASSVARQRPPRSQAHGQVAILSRRLRSKKDNVSQRRRGIAINSYS